MKYESIGISCYYRQDDQTKSIFFIKLTKEFEAYTEKGLVLDWNVDITVADVANLYGRNESYLTSVGPDQSYLRYNGIMFYVDKEDTDKKPVERIYINSTGII